jgi:hypothetical protein
MMPHRQECGATINSGLSIDVLDCAGRPSAMRGCAFCAVAREVFVRVPTLEAKSEKRTGDNNRCLGCGMVPPHSERGIFFARGLCAWCAIAVDRDDLRQTWERAARAAMPPARQRTRSTKPR